MVGASAAAAPLLHCPARGSILLLLLVALLQAVHECSRCADSRQAPRAAGQHLKPLPLPLVPCTQREASRPCSGGWQCSAGRD